MSELNESPCPECDGLDRRDFVRAIGGTAVTLVGLEAVGRVSAAVPEETPRPARGSGKPAEALVRELYSGLSDEQRRAVCHAWDHGAGDNAIATRLRMYNAALGRRIGDIYTRPQQELIERILRSISSGDDGYQKI